MKIMTTRRSICLLGIVLMAGLPVAAAEPVGFVAASEGDASLLRGGETSWALALVDQDVEIGDTARTRVDSALKLVLVDDTTLTLGEDTELVIDELLVGPVALREISVLRQISGKLRVRVGEAFGGSTRLQVHTPTAVMGVKGTEFTSWVLREEGETHTLVCNTGGAVWVAAAGGGVAEGLPIVPGKCRRVTELGEVGPEIPMPADAAPQEPVSPTQKQVLAMVGPRPTLVTEILDETVIREELPPVGFGDLDPVAVDRGLEKGPDLFEDSFDRRRKSTRPSPPSPGFSTGLVGGAPFEPGSTMGLVGGAPFEPGSTMGLVGGAPFDP